MEDLLCLARIEKGTFRKNVTTFKLREAIQEIISIQKEKADFGGINVSIEFDRIDEEIEVATDMQRL